MPDITSAGERQIATLQEILRRCEAVGERVQFSGEGGERRFRHWLATDFLDEVLGWPSTQILVGERFDVTLLSDETVPLITIETKTPYHTASAKEKRDFEGRLSALPTLRYAIFTNGEDWERYRLERTSDGFIIEQDGSFALSVGPALKVQTFFKPLEYSGRQALPQGYRFRISKDEPFLQSALARLTADLEGVIADLIIYYSSLFQGFREGHAGPDAKSITEAIYEKWSGDSLRVRPSQLADAISSVLRQDPTLPAVLSAMRNYGFSGDMAQQVAETILALPAKAQREASNVEGQVWPLFEPSVRQLCAQTAHVQVARILLYRVGEDEDVFEKKLIGSALQSILSAPTHDVQGWKFAVSDALESVRVMMHTFLPSVYELSEFDWWMVKTDVRSLLTNRHQDWLLPRDEERERILHRALQKFSRYSFEAVDLDIWRNLYERYLPPDERQKLGGFYTPDPLINLVLDLAGYDSETPGLCNLSYIDPACGSGAFVTNALGRLIRHLDSPMPCHSPLHERNSSPMQRREALLRIVERNVNAIDLHPFASFLTTMNVLFTILPRYVRARNDNPRFSMTLNVFSWDALDQPGVGSDDQARLNLWRKMNSRMERSERDHERYVKLVTTGFDRVFGNPPWGGVLKGPLGKLCAGL